MDKEYLKIVKHYENCFDQYGDSAKGVDWPTEKGANLRYQVMLDVIKFSNMKDHFSTPSILDFGCGTSGLYEFIIKSGLSDVKYSGLDLSEKYINKAKQKYPKNDYYRVDLLSEHSQLPSFDFVIANGVFTEKRELNFEDMWEYFQRMMLKIYPLARKGIAFNVMSKSVDWERWDLFHVSTDLMVDFIVSNFNRNFIIRNDYGLYEYTIYLYK